MKTIVILVFSIIMVHVVAAQPAEGAYFSNNELQLHPRKVVGSNGQIAYMWSDCYEQLNFMQRADLKLYYDSVLIAINKKVEEAKINATQNTSQAKELNYLQAEQSFYTRKLKYIKDYDDWEEKE
jgi:hypothetical protein